MVLDHRRRLVGPDRWTGVLVGTGREKSMTAALWETLNGLGYIACALWILAFLVGMARPQVLKCQDRGGVFRLCSIGFLLSFVVMAVSWSKFNGVA